MVNKHIKYLVVIVMCFSYSFNLQGQNDKKTCIDCHESLIKLKVVHPPAEDACDNCHQSNGKQHPQTGVKAFSLIDQMPTLCYNCHDKNTKKNIHAPVEAGECTLCHSPHSSSNSNLLKEKPTSKLCFECHDLEIPKTDLMHAPVKEGKCNACHDPHESDNDKLLIVKKPQLCFNCHEDQNKEAKMKNVHPPFDDDCANCHKPHSSQNKNLLTQKTPNLCFDCHDDFTKIKQSKSVHKVITDEKNCLNCHSPHASNNSKLLIAQNNNLCFLCHNKIIKTKNELIDNIYYKVKNGKSVHAPIDIDGCTSCHNPHYSDNNFLLNFSYPKQRYVEATVQNFALCFECHDSGLLTEENTKSATNFRNGEKNLHFLHINGKNGRNCNLCHDIHASQNLHLIKEKVKFGNWEMNMNYKPSKNGGSCFPGCHAEKKYIRQ